jgi:hypothetical protein
MNARGIALAALIAVGSSTAALADNIGVAVAGAVQHPETLSADDLRKLPPVSVSISFETDKGAESASYTGALLWNVVAAAVPVDAPGKNTKLRHTILVTGRDGYAVAISEGEIDPAFEGKSVLLAYDKDGTALDGVRLVVPGDHHGGRAVRDVVRIDVR